MARTPFTTTRNRIAAGNAGWRFQFVEKSLVDGCHRSRVPELDVSPPDELFCRRLIVNIM